LALVRQRGQRAAARDRANSPDGLRPTGYVGPARWEAQNVIVVVAVVAVLILAWLLFRAEWTRRRH